MIGGGGIQRTAQRPRHFVVAFGAMLATHILKYADVTVRHKYFIALRKRLQHGRGFTARGAALGVIRRARKKNRRVLGAIWNNNHRVQLHAVAHGNHDFALLVVGFNCLRKCACGEQAH